MMRPRNSIPVTTLDKIIFRWDWKIPGFSLDDFSPVQIQGVISLEEIQEVLKSQVEHPKNKTT